MLQLTSAAGLLGALLMFCGDMLLYFTAGEYNLDGTFRPYIEIMKKLPGWRLKIGGLLGPVAAFFYCIGYSGICFAATEEAKAVALIAALLYCLGIILGGAYHSHFTYIGLLGKTGDETGLAGLVKNIGFLSNASMLPIAIASVLLSGLILLGKTVYPPWFVLLTPTVLLWLRYVWLKVPQPFRVVLFGGWNNLLFVIYFLGALLLGLPC